MKWIFPCALALLAIIVGAATYGAIASCKHSGGTFLQNYECIDLSAADFCVFEERIYVKNGMNSFNLSGFLGENDMMDINFSGGVGK